MNFYKYAQLFLAASLCAFPLEVSATDSATDLYGQEITDQQLLIEHQNEIRTFNRNIENANQEDSPIDWEKKSNPKVILVMQSYLKDTYYRSRNPIIGTYGAWPCFIIAAYNLSTQRAALCHMDTLYLEAVRYMLFSMQEAHKNSQIEIHLAGGNGADLERLKETKQLIDFI